MVSPRRKKAKEKVSRDAEAIVEEPEVKFVAEKPKEIVLEKTVTLDASDTPKTVDSKLLLAEAPAIPTITTMRDAIQFVDKYAAWKRRAKLKA